MKIIHDATCLAVATGEENECNCISKVKSEFLEPIEQSIQLFGLRCNYPICNWFSGYFYEDDTMHNEEIADVLQREYLEHCNEQHA